jgi:hypothetical protein
MCFLSFFDRLHLSKPLGVLYSLQEVVGCSYNVLGQFTPTEDLMSVDGMGKTYVSKPLARQRVGMDRIAS